MSSPGFLRLADEIRELGAHEHFKVGHTNCENDNTRELPLSLANLRVPTTDKQGTPSAVSLLFPNSVYTWGTNLL